MKFFFSTLTGGLVVVGLLAVIIGSVLWARLPDMLASHLSNKLHVGVSIDKMGAGWQEITIEGVQIQNVPRSILPNAFTCAQIAIHTPLPYYIKREIVIEEIDLNNIYLGLEFDSAKGTSGNWTTLMSNLTSSMRSSGPQEPSSRSLLIRKIILTNIDVDVVYRKEGNKIHKLPRIPRMELTNISSEGAFPVDQISNSVLGEMLKEVFIKQNLNNMLQDFLQKQNPLKNYLSPFDKLFNFSHPEDLETDNRV